jgi:serine/threonine-protein kinase 40
LYKNFSTKIIFEFVCFQVPKDGTLVETKTVKRAGPYLLGPILGSSPVRSIVQCLARRDGTDNFYTLKVGDKYCP